MSTRSNALADRAAKGAAMLADYASKLDDTQWKMKISAKDTRTVGVVVHHVASVYPIEIQLAMLLAEGKEAPPSWNDVHQMNAGHARDHANVTKEEALKALRENSAKAVEAIRALTDAQLDSAAPCGLCDGAPMTCQFLIEDHAMRHSWHHLAGIRAAVESTARV
jgi:hypothetical protein